VTPGAGGWTEEQLQTRHRASLRLFYELVAGASAGARLVELDGVTACIAPIVPERSFPNAVLYDRAESLVEALPALEDAYDDAGVRAWTVWVPEADDAAGKALADAGHAIDGTPLEMGAPLDELDLEPRRALDLDADAGSLAVAVINDTAYGLGGTLLPAFAAFPSEGIHVYVARDDGLAAACVVAADRDGDCGIFLAATLPAAQGRGLCGELLRTALRDARERGCQTTSLEATRAGEPIYRRIGYRDLGRLQMWERRG
jgi:ribosomal protein S18 acetylase RimI-like enzyme